MFDSLIWLQGPLGAAIGSLVGWLIGRKKEDADLNTQAAKLFKEFSEDMKSQVDHLQKRVDNLQLEIDTARIRMRALENDNAKLLHDNALLLRELANYTTVDNLRPLLSLPQPNE